MGGGGRAGEQGESRVAGCCRNPGKTWGGLNHRDGVGVGKTWREQESAESRADWEHRRQLKTEGLEAQFWSFFF